MSGLYATNAYMLLPLDEDPADAPAPEFPAPGPPVAAGTPFGSAPVEFDEALALACAPAFVPPELASAFIPPLSASALPLSVRAAACISW